MAGQRQREAIGRDAAAIVNDADQGFAAIGVGHFDTGGAGVDCILDQLFDGRGRAFDHFARCDTVDRTIVELANDRLICASGAYVGVILWHAARLSTGPHDSATALLAC
jgi:hypothetical protein